MLPKDLLVHLEKSDTRMGEILAKPIVEVEIARLQIFEQNKNFLREMTNYQYSGLGQQNQYNQFQQVLGQFVGIGQAIAGRPF